MRLILAAIVIVLLPAVAVAQVPLPSLPPAAGPLPPIGLPLPPIGLPLPPIGLPPVVDTQQRIDESQRARGLDRRNFDSRTTLGFGGAAVYFFPWFAWGYPYPGQIVTTTPAGQDAPARQQKPLPPTGFLRLEVQPSRMQLFIDGFYVGTPEDFNGELELEAGPHKIELRMPGYESQTFDVRILPSRAITFTGALKPTGVETPEVEPEPLPAAPPPTTFYFIPGCYLGNVPPEKVSLPPTCDLSRLITRKP